MILELKMEKLSYNRYLRRLEAYSHGLMDIFCSETLQLEDKLLNQVTTVICKGCYKSKTKV